MSGKPVAIVTGASRGAGRGIAVRVDHADDAQLKVLMTADPEKFRHLQLETPEFTGHIIR